jgi:hypothetical protein
MSSPGQLAGRYVRTYLRDCALAFGVSLVLVLVIAAFRFWPRISAPGLPAALIWPFARPLAASALEVAYLIGIPVGVSLVAARVRVSSLNQWADARAIVAVVLGSALFVFGLSSWLDRDTDSPGRLASDLLAGGRSMCLDERPTRIDVPMVGVTWVCEGQAAPRVEGRAPMGKTAHFSASELTLSDDLRQLGLRDFVLDMKLTSGPPKLVMRAKTATIVGLAPWGRPRKLSVWFRAVLFTMSVLCASLASVWWVARISAGRAYAGVVGAAAALSMWWLSLELDRGPGGAVYWLMPLIGMAAASAFGGLLILARRVRSPVQKH